jgi:hypothetical protein
VYSVHGLYRAFPPPDPPVYVRPQLKPPCGICSFTTTTFGAHHGADQGTGRSTSGRDLLCLLEGSTSASPPNTAGRLHLPGLTSTRPGRHTVVPDLHQHFQAGIFFPGSAIDFLGPAYLCPSRHIYVPTDICRTGVDSDISLAGIYDFWSELTSSSWIILISAYSGRILQVLGRTAASQPTWASAAQSRCSPGRLPPGGPAPPSSRPAHPGLPAAAVPSCPGLHHRPTSLGRLDASPLCWATPTLLLSSWAPARPQSRRCIAPCQPGWAAPGRPDASLLRWAVPSSVSSALGRVGTGLAGLIGPCCPRFQFVKLLPRYEKIIQFASK